jgi:hypothetical protein
VTIAALGMALIGLLASAAMGASDRALMLALPSVAVLAAFALPTLNRSTSSAIDWFSVFFFTVLALFVWVIYIAMQTGVPAKPAANVAKLAPGFKSHFALLPLIVATAATLAWLWLVRWRTARHPQALWKSLVLPASGVALCWLLLMTLWLPLLDYARSYRALIERVRDVVRSTVPPGARVLVISRGDEEIVDLPAHRAGHFPQAPDGAYAGFHPADSGEAIASLRALHAAGAEYLVVPATSGWWLEHYGQLAAHLDRDHERIAEEDGLFVCFALRDPAGVSTVA